MPGPGSPGEPTNQKIEILPGPEETLSIILSLGDAHGTQVTFKIPKSVIPFSPAQIFKLIGLPIGFQITQAQHVELENLVHQPNQLLARFKQIVESNNLPFLKIFIDWFFTFGRRAILREIIRQLGLPSPPPPPPPPATRCCA